MENFIKVLSETIILLENKEMHIRIFDKIKTKSGYGLSIQCSEYHYCTPRETINVEKYDSFELAIFRGHNFVYPKILDNFPRKNELDECYKGEVFGYVPKDLVEDLYNFLND